MQQFYTVLHSSPRYLHRFYTDASTFTHYDGGVEGAPPSAVNAFTVSKQKVRAPAPQALPSCSSCHT